MNAPSYSSACDDKNLTMHDLKGLVMKNYNVSRVGVGFFCLLGIWGSLLEIGEHSASTAGSICGCGWLRVGERRQNVGWGPNEAVAYAYSTERRARQLSGFFLQLSNSGAKCASRQCRKFIATSFWKIRRKNPLEFVTVAVVFLIPIKYHYHGRNTGSREQRRYHHLMFKIPKDRW